MDRAEITRRRNALIARLGEWSAACVHLGDGAYTFNEPQRDFRIRRYLQAAADLATRPLNELRVLDLGCGEGIYGIEFALHGAEVVGVEGREVNLARARFSAEVLRLENLRLIEGDVRRLDSMNLGTFDVVLCLGLLYHLDAPEVMGLVSAIAGLCNRVTLIDTHVSPAAVEPFEWRGHSYWGRRTIEHDASATAEERRSAVWYSLDNEKAFQLTRPSLLNLLRHAGFTSVSEVLNPHEYHARNWPHASLADEDFVVWRDRITLAAIAGRQEKILSSPITETSPEIDRPEVAVWREDL